MKHNRCELFDNEATTILPKINETEVNFKSFNKTILHPFNIYYDLESILINVSNEKNIYQTHQARNVGVKLISRYPDLIKDEYIQFDGENCIIDFFNYLFKIEEKILNIIKTVNKDINMTIDDYKDYRTSNKCYLCYKEFNNNDNNLKKVRDHDHLNGKYRGAAHSICNINLNNKNIKIPVVAHNSKGYDSHFLM